MAGALGMLICFVGARDARDDGDERDDEPQFEAASCKGCVERPSGGRRLANGCRRVRFSGTQRVQNAITAIALLQRVT